MAERLLFVKRLCCFTSNAWTYEWYDLANDTHVHSTELVILWGHPQAHHIILSDPDCTQSWYRHLNFATYERFVIAYFTAIFNYCMHGHKYIGSRLCTWISILQALREKRLHSNFRKGNYFTIELLIGKCLILKSRHRYICHRKIILILDFF
jgi:hypothetical protein